MVILRFDGTEPPGYVRRVLREGRAAGVILFRDNVVSPDQLRRMTRTLRERDAGRDRCLRRPGGRRGADAPVGGARALGARAAGGGDRPGRRPGAGPPARRRRLRHARAGGRRPQRRGRGDRRPLVLQRPRHGAAAVAESVGGWHANGVATTVKHFPGLGGATVNTDDGTATIKRSRTRDGSRPRAVQGRHRQGDRVRDGRPRDLSGLDGVHIASQSPAIIDGLLRDELGFKGVVMTDSLEAAAVQAVGDVEESAVASARAGVDVILTTGRGSYIRVYRALLAEARGARRVPRARARVRRPRARRAIIHGWLTPQPLSGSATRSRPSS